MCPSPSNRSFRFRLELATARRLQPRALRCQMRHFCQVFSFGGRLWAVCCSTEGPKQPFQSVGSVLRALTVLRRMRGPTCGLRPPRLIERPNEHRMPSPLDAHKSRKTAVRPARDRTKSFRPRRKARILREAAAPRHLPWSPSHSACQARQRSRCSSPLERSVPVSGRCCSSPPTSPPARRKPPRPDPFGGNQIQLGRQPQFVRRQAARFHRRNDQPRDIRTDASH